MSRPAKVVVTLILVGAVVFAIYGYFVVRGSDEAYWAPLIPLFVLIYAGIAVGVVAGLDWAIRSVLRRNRATP
jgi:drug/metabolite transporter (DMT)-like permease